MKNKKRQLILHDICIFDPLRPTDKLASGREIGNASIGPISIPDDLARRFIKDTALALIDHATTRSDGRIQFGPFSPWTQSRIIEKTSSYKEIIECIVASGSKDTTRGRNDVERLFRSVKMVDMFTAISVYKFLHNSGILKRIKIQAREIMNERNNKDT